MRPDYLRQIPLFSELADADLERLASLVEMRELKAGELLFEEGSHGDQAYIIQSGELKVFQTRAGQEQLLARRGSGEVIGEIALIEDRGRMASVSAAADSTLIVISKQQLQQLMDSSPHAAQGIFKSILHRLRETRVRLQQSEKLARLGTLTAGIAHELNNPSSAVQRSTAQLKTELERFERSQSALMSMDLDPAQLDLVSELRQQALLQVGESVELDALLRSDKQEQLEIALQRHSIENVWELSSELVDLGMTPEDIDKLAAIFPGPTLIAVLRWWTARFLTWRLLKEVETGAARIQDIVAAMKSYAYLDQSPVQEVDIHKGLEDTLLILNSKIKQKDGLSIERHYEDSLPHVYGFGSELNQVWTNLLDNAIDAVGNPGRITIQTRSEVGWVVVSIEDDGQGIPDAIQPRIFDPFFTTKPPGEGTGMGLDISYNIVVHKHRGAIRVESKPGRTRFEVRLPLDFTHLGPEQG